MHCHFHEPNSIEAGYSLLSLEKKTILLKYGQLNTEIAERKNLFQRAFFTCRCDCEDLRTGDCVIARECLNPALESILRAGYRELQFCWWY